MADNTPNNTNEENMSTSLPRESSGVFFVNIKDKLELYNIYMPFITGGALFVHTDKQCHLGDEVFLLVKLLDEPEKYPLSGKVIWITPNCAQGGRLPGLGVQFIGEEGQEVRNKIETYLATTLQSDRHTDSM